MTCQLEIEARSPGPKANTLPTQPSFLLPHSLCIMISLYIYGSLGTEYYVLTTVP